MKNFPELKSSNIPIINLLGRFITRYNDFHRQEIIDYFDSHKHKLLKDKKFYFFQFPNEFLSFILRDIILYFESYLKYNLWSTAHAKKRKDVLALVKNPSMADREVAKAAFHTIPSKVDSAFSLKVHKESLYEYMLRFYKDIRNPLFHGNQLNPGVDIHDFVKVLDVYKELYLWVAHWTCGDLLLGKDEKGHLTIIDKHGK